MWLFWWRHHISRRSLKLNIFMNKSNSTYIISTSNHMFGRAICDKLPKCIFENFEIARVKRRVISKFSKIPRVIYPRNLPNQTCLLFNHTKPTNTLYWNWNLLTAGNYKSASGQLQNNSVNGAVLITVIRVIT